MECILCIRAKTDVDLQRLSAMIHTRLTVLQARLSLHQAAAVGAMSVPVMPAPHQQPWPCLTLLPSLSNLQYNDLKN